jgi:thiosulfate dehydrogenase (quinone) large subunit
MESHGARSSRRAGGTELLTDEPRWILLPLRAFLAFVFLYAGLSKIADRRFLDSSSPISIHATTLAVKSASPIGGLLGPVIDHSFAFGLFMACAELAVGIGLLLGLLTRLAAAGGVLLALSLFLTVSWQSSPWYTGADIVYVFALTPLILAGPTPLSLDAWLAETRSRDTSARQFAVRRTLLAGLAGLAGLVALGAASLFRVKEPTQAAQPGQSGGSTGTTGSGTTLAVSQVPVGGGKQITDATTGQTIWVLQLMSGNFTAFNASCPHQGCPVRFTGASSGFTCPCHQSSFTAQGKVTRGPANRDLTEVKVTKSGSDLRVG